VRCTVLQCVAVCCSVLQCVAVGSLMLPFLPHAGYKASVIDSQFSKVYKVPPFFCGISRKSALSSFSTIIWVVRWLLRILLPFLPDAGYKVAPFFCGISRKSAFSSFDIVNWVVRSLTANCSVLQRVLQCVCNWVVRSLTANYSRDAVLLQIG